MAFSKRDEDDDDDEYISKTYTKEASIRKIQPKLKQIN